MASEEEDVQEQVEKALARGNGPKVTRFVLAALAGAIPIGGGIVSGVGGAWSEQEQSRVNNLLATWLKLQKEEIEEIGVTLAEVMSRLDPNDDEIMSRVESKEYLSLVKKCFRDWSAAESESKRCYIRNLLVNAASCNLTSDDVIKLFIDWVDKYSEAHFAIIALVYKNYGITRYGLWQKLHGGRVREDSAEADLFKLIIHDLSVGHVMRQHRDIDGAGNFRKTQHRRPRVRSSALTSAFDDSKEYELTALGNQFVHYTMNELVPRIAAPKGEPPSDHPGTNESTPP